MEQIRNLDPRIQECILKRGFEELSEIQSLSLPQVQTGKNLILIAPTGTGKTESAMIPVFDALFTRKTTGFSAIYITPLRSLNRDMLQRLSWWCRELGITIGVRHGDTPTSERRRQALSPPELLITTPETLQALFMGKVLRKHLRNVRYVIVDEIHDLAGSKRGAQLSIALERLVAYAGEFQRIGLSATVGNPDEMGRFLSGNREFSVVQVDVTKHLDIAVEFAGDRFEEQAGWISDTIDRYRSTLIFVNTRVTAEALGHQLFSRGDVEVHHGSLSRDVRIDAEERFKSGEIRGLICTSSMELGIDIGHIEHVIQFGSPREVSRLVQRIGRAGHSLYETSRGTILALGFDDLLESQVIARRAKAGEVEDVFPPVNSADVLANQVAGMAVEYGKISKQEIRAIIDRSYSFSTANGLLDEVCAQMADHRLIRIDGETIITTMRARRYLAGNLSMIHDEKKVGVFDMVSRRTVGTLDESFVVASIYTGAVFITKGQLWRVLDMEEGRIIVEPARMVKGELPSWEGEQIPVPFAVAREVGALRRTRLFSSYDSSIASTDFAVHFLEEMDRNKSIIPTDRVIVLEDGKEGVICNCCAGHKANEALGRVVSVLLSARFGTTVGIEIDAYRILFRLPSSVKAADVRELLTGLDPAHVEGILQLAMKRTTLFKWKLVQIAKKFGAIDPDADYDRLSNYKLTELFENTVVQMETYRELFSVYMDVATTAVILQRVKVGETEIRIGRLSILGADGLFSSRDQMPPPTADHAVITTLRRRIEQQDIILVCMNCRKWKSKTITGRVLDPPICPRCSARLIAVLKPWEEPLFSIAKKKEKSDEEKAVESRLIRNANIVLSGGKKAVLALAAKGVGPEIASRILATLTEGDAFFKEILKAERNYIRTRRYW